MEQMQPGFVDKYIQDYSSVLEAFSFEELIEHVKSDTFGNGCDILPETKDIFLNFIIQQSIHTIEFIFQVFDNKLKKLSEHDNISIQDEDLFLAYTTLKPSLEKMIQYHKLQTKLPSVEKMVYTKKI